MNTPALEILRLKTAARGPLFPTFTRAARALGDLAATPVLSAVGARAQSAVHALGDKAVATGAAITNTARAAAPGIRDKAVATGGAIANTARAGKARFQAWDAAPSQDMLDRAKYVYTGEPKP